MGWDSIYVVNDRLATARAEDLDELERRLDMPLPAGYREFAQRFGEGVLCGFLRIYSPARVLAETDEFRQSLGEDPPWSQGPLSSKELGEAVVFGDSLQGDRLVLHPGYPGRIFVLPHQSQATWEAGDKLEEALDWICSSGELVAPICSRYFESELDRVRHRFEGLESRPGLLARLRRAPTYAAVRQALLDLGLHDAVDEAHPEDGEACIQLFVREFQGSVTLIEADRLIALICRDRALQPPALEKLVSALTRLGFRPAD